MINLISNIKNRKELYSKNTIKVVKIIKMKHYIFRQVIPFIINLKLNFISKFVSFHLKFFLFEYAKLKHKSLEISESIDM